MTKFRQMGKKALNVVVASSTIMWSVGFAALAPVSAAPSLAAGDLVKASGPAVYYYTADGKRAPFPNDKVYKSWYADYSMVKTITDAELAALSLSGTNMTYRAGTRLVKITTDPKTYAVEPNGSLRWIKDEATAKALYGDTWNKQIDDVADVFFTNYSQGTEVASATPTVGSLIKTAASSDLYYIDTTGKRKLSDSTAFAANGFQLANVRTVADSVLAGLTAGAPVTGKEAALAMPWGGSTPAVPTNPAPSAGTALTIALATDTPATTSVIADSDATDSAQALASMLKLNFTAGSAAVKVTTLKLKRTGISADTDVSNAYLYDGSTRLAEMTSVASGVVSFTSTAGLFSVPAGTTKSVLVKMDLADGTGSGKTLGFSLNAAADVTTDGATVSGTFPVSGNPMSTASISDLGKLTIANSSPTGAATVDPGQTGYQAWRFTAAAADQKVQVSSMKMTLIGSVAAGDLKNFKLMDGATQLGATIAELPEDKVLAFDFGTAPLMITAGSTKNIDLKVDVVAGSSRNFKLSFQRQSDIVAMDTNYNVSIKPVTGNRTFTVTTASSNSATTNTSVNNGSLALSVPTDSPTGNIAQDATDVEFVRFDLKAAGESVKITSLTLTSTLSAGTGLDQIKTLVDGSQLGSTQDLTAAGVAYSFGNSLVIPAGQTKTVVVKGNVKQADGTQIVAGTTVVVSLAAGASNAQGQTSLTTLSTSAVTGRTRTVQSGTLTRAKNLAFSDGSSTVPTSVKGASGAKIASFVLTAGAGEGVTVNQLQLIDSVTSNTTAVANASWAEATNDNTLAAGEVVTLTTAPARFVVGETYGLAKTGTLATATTFAVTAKDATTVTGTIGAAAAITDAADGVTLASAFSAGVAATDTLADTFQNLKLMQGTTQIGQAISTLTDTAATSYTFTPSSAISIAAGQQAVFDVYADVKSTATTLSVNVGTTAPLSFDSATAVGAVTSTTASVTTDLELQKPYIAGAGTLAVAVAGDTPLADQQLMGATDVELAKFQLSETSNSEKLNLTQIVLTDTVAANTHGSINNIKLYNGATLLGTVATLASTGATTGTATFTGLALEVPKGGNLNLSVKANITSYDQVGTAGSGATHVMAISSETGTGGSSGSSITSVASTGTAATMTVYRTKLTIAHAQDAPSGLSAGSTGQIVGKIVVSNLANVGNYNATLNGMELSTSSTIDLTAATSVRYVRMFKNTVSGTITHAVPAATGNALGAYGHNSTAVGNCTTATNLKCSAADVTAFGNLTLDAANFVDVIIASGSSLTIIVTADTNDAASAKSFSTGIDAGAITWTDGVTAGITSVPSLPLTAKTVSY